VRIKEDVRHGSGSRQYAFIVWGVNAGGGSAKAAVKKVKIG